MGVIEYTLFTVAIVEIKDGIFSSGKGYITAHIQFQQNKDDEIRIIGSVQGLPPADSSKYGFHVHKDPLLDNDCTSCGTHFNPLNSKHGPPGGMQGMIHFYTFETTSNEMAGRVCYPYIYIYIYD